MFTRLLYVRGHYHGLVIEHGQRSASGGIVAVSVPMSYVLLCPHCGDVWARFPIGRGASPDNVSWAEQEWLSLRYPCQKHTETWADTIPGSVLGPFLPPLEQLPESLIQEEARLHLKYWENQNGS